LAACIQKRKKVSLLTVLGAVTPVSRHLPKKKIAPVRSFLCTACTLYRMQADTAVLYEMCHSIPDCPSLKKNCTFRICVRISTYLLCMFNEFSFLIYEQ
jgi:hypothetical protein